MNRVRNERGTALVATLSIAMILLPLGAFVVLQARTDIAIQYNLRSETEAFYVAEAGLEHAIAEIQPGRSFDPLLLGADHNAGTSDDGTFPFAEGAPADFPQAPFHYDVHVTSVRADLIQIASQGSGRNGATRTLQALVTRSPLPCTPGALYVEGNVGGLDIGSEFQLSGYDAAGTQAPVPALGTAAAGAESTLRQRLSDSTARQLLGTGTPPSIATPASLGLESYAASVMSSSSSVTLPDQVDAGVSLGTSLAPQLSVAPGDLTITGQASGYGMLVVHGTLHISGAFNFTGVVLVMGAVVFEPASDVRIKGALWRATSVDDRLKLLGRGQLDYDSGALARVDHTFPGQLPHATAVVGWQEDL